MGKGYIVMSETLKERLQEDMKAALRAKEKQRLGTIRLIHAAIKQREIDERVSLDDAQVIVVLDKMLKQRRDSFTQYEQAGRQDLADQEAFEIAVIQAYLPQPLTEEELTVMLKQALADSQASSIKDLGKVMGLLKPQLQGRADMRKVSEQVKQLLTD
jgi:hypothetical protein